MEVGMMVVVARANTNGDSPEQRQHCNEQPNNHEHSQWVKKIIALEAGSVN
jgi:hypothetical protein